jgi:hypothetical protein
VAGEQEKTQKPMTKHDALHKYELIDATTGDGTVWVGLMTASHPVKHSVATVWIYRFGVDHDGYKHALEGGELVGTASYHGVRRLYPETGDIPEHVLDHLMPANMSRFSEEDPQ